YDRVGAQRRSRDLLEVFGLADAATRQVKKYSGGMRRRIDIAASLVVTPELMFLDEPTTGLDPRSRNQVWDIVRGLVANGTTVLLTTQYLEEAYQLAERITVIDHGRVIAEDTSAELKSSVREGAVHVRLHNAADRPDAEGIIAAALGTPVVPDADPMALSARADDDGKVADALAGLHRAGIDVASFSLGQPSLDEVFLALTGRP